MKGFNVYKPHVSFPDSPDSIEAMQAELDRLKAQDAERRRVAQERAAERARIQAEVERRTEKRAKELIAEFRAQQERDLEAAALRLAVAQLNFELAGPSDWEHRSRVQPPKGLSRVFIEKNK